jgi:hypothetical protein
MARNSTRTRRIFGGKEPARDPTDTTVYQRELLNPADQAVAETLPVGTTRRRFPGPSGDGLWSYFISCTEGGAATSELKFYFSNLPDPDPDTAGHWEDSGISAIDLSATGVTFATRPTDYPTWIMAEAVVVTNTADLLGYVRCAGVEE